ncbi:hypothetical protein [Castellaniella sp.]|uniref:hypothetical protein n=1 Tax=Castellaniella sp. TaxID=1955812 RepID=UPI002AFEDA88|nr:hypothetical protein [Castellaniella sp.]
MAGSIGLAWTGSRRGAALPYFNTAGALQGPWVPGGSWGGRLAGRSRTAAAARRQATAVSAAPVVRMHRPQAGARIGWRRLAALAGDVLMVLVWAAMIPGLMWLGAVAGF